MRRLATGVLLVSLAGAGAAAAAIGFGGLDSTTELAMRAGPGRDRVAHKMLELRARLGEVAAQRLLGGLDLDAGDSAAGLRWTRAAADAGDPAAQTRLGQALLGAEHGLQADPSAAQRLFERAAGQGHAGAAYRLGVLLHRNPATAAQAAVWLEQAAAREHPAAMFMLANAYRDADGVPRDAVRALALYRQAAQLDYPPAAQELAMAYQQGGLGLPQDAAQFAQQLAETAHALKHPPVLP